MTTTSLLPVLASSGDSGYLYGLFFLIVALIIGKNEEDIQLVPALAFFMPLIAAMAGNVGVQSSAIVVQALASDRKENKMIQKLTKELAEIGRAHV